MATNVEIGQKGEEIAKKYLLHLGYEFLIANYRFQHLEIDLIFMENDTLVVVEVKTRNTTALGEPYEAVTFRKQQQIIRAANQYILQENIDREVRFDVVSIVLYSNGTHHLEHIIDAFTP